jgi:hypothetical protein
VRKTETIRKELGSLSPVLERRIEDMLAEGLKPSMATSLEMLDVGASGRKAIDEELESVRKRKVQLVEELKSLDDYLQDSKDYVGLNPPDFINAISTALELNNCPPRRLRAQGFVHTDLARACVGQIDDAIRRVVLLGRISLYGPGASRLHDEIIAVAARWIDPIARKGPLAPYAGDTEKLTLHQIDDVCNRTLPPLVNRDGVDLAAT